VCTILLAWQCVGDAHFVVGANRDELVQRQAAPPELLSTDPLIAGGRDLFAGGTWLAVAADARLCAVTNRRPTGGSEIVRDASRHSRGEIPLRVLTEVGERRLPDFLAAIPPDRYNPVNVMYVSASLAVVASVDGDRAPRVTILEPGVHVLTVGDIDDPTRAKDQALGGLLQRTARGASSGADLELSMRTLLSRHDSATDDARDAACIHGDEYGTVSSATVTLTDDALTYRHAQGRPCTTPFSLVRALEPAT
jgi:uncharacterized protein with NRDE domain